MRGTPTTGGMTLAEITAAPEPPAPVEARPRLYYGYYLILAALVAQFVSMGAGNYILGPFLEPMTDDLGWSRSEFTIARTIGQVVDLPPDASSLTIDVAAVQARVADLPDTAVPVPGGAFVDSDLCRGFAPPHQQA